MSIEDTYHTLLLIIDIGPLHWFHKDHGPWPSIYDWALTTSSSTTQLESRGVKKPVNRKLNRTGSHLKRVSVKPILKLNQTAYSYSGSAFMAIKPVLTVFFFCLKPVLNRTKPVWINSTCSKLKPVSKPNQIESNRFWSCKTQTG